jgi:glucokinase
VRSYIGIEIGGTKLQVVLGDEKAVISERRRFTVELPKGATGIRENIAQAVTELRGLAQVQSSA